MTTASPTDTVRVYRPQWLASALLLLTGAFLVWALRAPLADLVGIWEKRLEYSYGYVIPLITAFLIWQKKDQLERIPLGSAWSGVLICLFGAFLLALGSLSSLKLFQQYALVVMLFGLALSFVGWRAFRLIWLPIAFLLFMIPIPNFFISLLSQELQLLSSELGVWFIRLFGITVYLEGNVIDLGSYRLQVVDACSGLRYLFPLMALGFIAAYFFTGAFWKKALIFLSTIPITIVMNSARIGAIGVLVEYWGPAMADGFLHDFEGWAVFMLCTGVLIIEMWWLARLGPQRLPLHQAFGIDMPAPTPAGARVIRGPFPRALLPAALVVFGIGLWVQTSHHAIVPPSERRVFAEFPRSFAGWEGRMDQLEQIYLDTLLLDDHLLADYRHPDHGRMPVNLYVAWYSDQHGQKTSHTPQSCLPGGGWQIAEIGERTLQVEGAPLTIKRVVISRGQVRQLVYYWFTGRGRDIADEYAMKWYLFVDALVDKRTDGALVRLTTPVSPSETLQGAEARLDAFLADTRPLLPAYIPD